MDDITIKLDEDSDHLDEELKNYLAVINPHITQIENHQIRNNCNKWIEKLGDLRNKHLRNKYTSLMCYQISKEYIDQPFLDEPPPELEDFIVADCSDSSRSGSAVTSEIHLNRNANVWTNPILNSTSENDCFESVSNVGSEPAASSSVETFGNPSHCFGDGDTRLKEVIPNDSKEDSLKTAVEAKQESKDFDVRKCNAATIPGPLMGRKSPPSVSPIIKNPKPKLSVVKTNSNHEERLRNLISKLREVKGQKDAEATRNGPLANERGVQISCVEMASLEIASLKKKYKAVLITRNQLSRKLKACEQRNCILEEMRRNLEREIASLNNSGQANVLEAQKIHEATTLLKEDLENRLREHLQKTSNFTTELEMKHRKEVDEKVKKILDLERIIRRLKMQIEMSNNSGCNTEESLVGRTEDKAISTDDYVANLERRVEKLTRSRIKQAKLYENKMHTLEQEKQILQTNLQFQILRHHETHTTAITQQEFAKVMEELEQKYMRMIALIQATAIKTRIQDQQNLETILRAMRGLKPEGISSSECPSFPSSRNVNQNFQPTIQQRQSVFEVKQSSGNTGFANQTDCIDPTFVEFCSCKNECSCSTIEFPQRYC